MYSVECFHLTPAYVLADNLWLHVQVNFKKIVHNRCECTFPPHPTPLPTMHSRVYPHTCTHLNTHTCTHLNTHTCTHLNTHTCTYTCTHSTNSHAHVCTTRIHTHAHTCTLTHSTCTHSTYTLHIHTPHTHSTYTLHMHTLTCTHTPHHSLMFQWYSSASELVWFQDPRETGDAV